MLRRILSRFWPAIALIAGSAVSIAYVFAETPGLRILHASVQNAATVSFAIASGIVLCRVSGRARTTWLLITVFAIGFSVAQVDWSIRGYETGPTPHGFWSDTLYAVFALPVGILGLISLAFAELRRSQYVRVLTDALVVAGGLALLEWVAFFALPSAEGRISVISLSTASPLLDIVAGAVVLTASIYQPHRRSLRWLAAVIPVATISDTLAALKVSPHSGSASAAVLVTMGFLAPMLLTIAVTRDADQDTDFPVQGERRQIINLFNAAGAIALAWAMFRDGGLDRVGALIAAGLVLAQVINQRSVFRELRILLGAHAETLEALKASEQEMRLAFEGAPVGIVVFEDGMLLSANQHAVRMLDIGGFFGRQARDFVPTQVVPEIDESDWQVVSPNLAVFDLDIEWPTPTGAPLWLHLSLAKDPSAGLRRVIATVEDISERRAATERLAHLAVHDPLTGLPNRMAFMDSLTEALANTSAAEVAVAFIDLDRFKVINDSVGHAGGDRMLVTVAERLREAVGRHGLVARFAGDEFTVLFVGCGIGDLELILANLIERLSDPLCLEGGVTTHPTASIGVGIGLRGENPDEILARADAAMYRAKEQGRNRVEFYEGSRAATAQAELRVVDELHRAIDQGQFRLFYQPVTDPRSGRTVAYEALARWQHPQRGLVGPDEFVDAAEASGLIIPIGEWVLREALTQLATWNHEAPEHPLTMSVNVATPQVTESFPDIVESIIAETGVDAGCVWLELTESALMYDIRVAEAVLQRLTEIGLHISVDDFGTGYSSLAYLQRLPVEGIKLDRSFVSGLGVPGRERDRAICQAVISLGSALGLRTVGEGVEHQRQLDELAAMGCDLIQGYLFGRPKPATELDRLTRAAAGPTAQVWSTTDRTTANAIR